MKAEGFFSRLESRKLEGETNYAFCRRINLNDASFASYRDQGCSPKATTVETLASALNVSPCWLAFGEGPAPAPPSV